MGKTESSRRRLDRAVKNPLKEPASVITRGDAAFKAAESGTRKRGLRVTSGKSNGKHSEDVLTAEAMGFDSVDVMSHEVGSLNLSDDNNGKSRATDAVLNAVPREVEGRMGRAFADAARASSSEEGDGGDSVSDLEYEVQREERSNTHGREAQALLDELMQVIKKGGELRRLKLDHLKAYLHHHGLRKLGVKEVLVSRIEEHLKIKDGQGEVMYPSASFTIKCKGDVCLGDTVLFSQDVYESYDPVKRCAIGPSLGKRWVAGKVVNESYGAEKQQHTFTIEVLWSAGIRPFQAMHPLLIKGRNLYRSYIRRQPWMDEDARAKVLSEKHARGEEARAKRRTNLGPRGRSLSRPRPRVHSATRYPRDPSGSVPPASRSSHQHDRNSVRQRTVGSTAASSSFGQNFTSVSSAFHGESIRHIACSNSRCAKAGAKNCVTQSCAMCCFKNGSTPASCPRHHKRGL